MRVVQCNLENFRNIRSSQLRFEEDSIYLQGRNAQGKSNLLEAIGLLQAVRSFRTNEQKNMIHHDELECRIFFKVKNENAAEEEILLHLKRNGEKKIELNGARCSGLGNFLGRYPVQILASDDIRIVRGSPAQRRRLMDLHLSTVEKGYYHLLRDYHRALSQRNKLLKNSAEEKLLRAYDQPLAHAAEAVFKARMQSTLRLQASFTEIYDCISQNKESPEFIYQPQTQDIESSQLLAKWNKLLSRDRILGSTQMGPHRDDWSLLLKNAKITDSASEGQQRNYVLALRLCLYRDLVRALGRNPVLLTDDVLGELDEERRLAFWTILPRDAQVIATGTRPLESDGQRQWIHYFVDSGTCTRKE